MSNNESPRDLQYEYSRDLLNEFPRDLQHEYPRDLPYEYLRDLQHEYPRDLPYESPREPQYESRRGIPDETLARPLVESNENSSPSMRISQACHWKQATSTAKSERVRKYKSMRNGALAMLRLEYDDVIVYGGEAQRELQREWETGLRSQAATTRNASETQ